MHNAYVERPEGSTIGRGDRFVGHRGPVEERRGPLLELQRSHATVICHCLDLEYFFIFHGQWTHRET